MRPRLTDQPTYDAQSLAMLEKYETEGFTAAALARRYGFAESTIRRRLGRARKQRSNEGKTLEAMHRRIVELENRIAKMETT